MAAKLPPRDQRAALCDALTAAGPDAGTLCEGWRTHDLAAHIWVRENQTWQVAASLLRRRGPDGLMAEAKAGRTYLELIDAIRQGPKGASPFRLPGMEAAANTIEFFVHCEDVRRGEKVRVPRPQDPGLERLAYARLPMLGRLTLRGCPVAVWLECDQTPGEPIRIGRGPDIVTLSGRPSEILLYLFGRRRAASVDIIGEPAAIALVERTKSPV